MLRFAELLALGAGFIAACGYTGGAGAAAQGAAVVGLMLFCSRLE
jgi:hypothetical protein